MANTLYKTKTWLAVAALALFGFTSIAQAEILYDGANTSGVTTDDQYIIDYDQTSTTNVDLQFGSASNYLRYDVVNDKFLLSSDLDLQSAQLLNARVQNVSVLADVPSCSAAGDRGKKIFTGALAIAGVNGAQTLDPNKEYICNDTNSAATRWVATNGGDATTLDNLDSTQFLRSDTSDSYTSGTLTFDPGTGVVFNTTNVTLPGTTSDTFNINNDAAAGDTSTLSFGDGSGQLIWDGTTSTFSTGSGNNLTVNGTTTSNSLVVNSGGSIDLNNNQVQNLTMENVAVLPGSPTTGRLLYLTANDTTAPGCSVAVPCTPGAYYFNGTKWVKDSADGASATLEFSPQYKDGVVRPDGTNNVGTMSSDTDATNNRNYYRWTTSNATLQDIDVVVDTRLPDDFGGFAASNALQYDIRSNDNSATNAKLDLSGKDTAATAMTISGTVSGVVPTAANTWQTKSHNITGGTYTAGSRIQLTFKLSALKSGTSRTFDLGNFRLNYIRKNP
jgi:hypothetical protein